MNHNQRGGKGGAMKRIYDFSKYSIIGAGGYGIVIKNNKSKKVFKLFRHLNECSILFDEAKIQYTIFQILKKYVPEVKVPRIFSVTKEHTSFESGQYICGIEMEFLQPPLDYTEQVHMLLGYHGDDIDESWGVSTAEPVSALNPTRGYFASPEQLELIWEAEESKMTIKKLAYLMGYTYRILLNHNILPIDIEWVWSGGRPCLIDFGLCVYGKKDPFVFLETKGLVGLASDFYIPHKGDRGYEEFMEGFNQST